MRRDIIGNKLFATLGAILLTAPVFLLFGAYFSPGRPALWLLPQAFALLLCCPVRALPGKARIPGLIAAVALGAGGMLYLGRVVMDCDAWLYTDMVLLAAAQVVHTLALSQQSGEEYHPAVWYAGIIIYVLARIVASGRGLTAAKPALLTLCLAYFLYAVFAINEQNLLEGMGGGRRPSRLMRLRNRGMAVLVCLALLVLTHLPAVARAFRTLCDALKRGVLWLFSLFTFPESNVPRTGGNGDIDLSGLVDEIAGPSPFLIFLEKVMRIIAMLLMAALALFILWQAGRLLHRAVRALIARLRAYTTAVTDAYEDTVESLLDWGEVKSALRARQETLRVRREERIPWDSLTPRQQVRRAYRHYLRRHPDIPPQRTARQALDSDRAAIYESARYSMEEITPEQARRMRTLQ